MANLIGDGIREDFLHFLWKKDSSFKEKLFINIPDTVVFRQGALAQWYFSNDNGELLRKKRENLTPENIIKTFTQKSKGDFIVPYFITMEMTEYSDLILKKRCKSASNFCFQAFLKNQFLVPKRQAPPKQFPTEYYTKAEFSKEIFSKDTY